jgi:hypothetical protein
MTPGRALLALIASSALAACGSNAAGTDAGGGICSDGLDNDGDNLADYPADPGCDDASDSDESNPPVSQCSDGRDNDGDGHIDFPNDPGCFNLLANREMDDCPTGPACPACGNDLDDDGDQVSDYPGDPGCAAASDDDEYLTNPNACGAGLIVERLQTSTAIGSFVSGGPSVLTGSCGGNGDEVVYELVFDEPTVVVASTDRDMTTANTVVYLLDECLAPTSELACNDDIEPAVNTKSAITASVPAGNYYLVIDNHDLVSAGGFALGVELFAGEGVECASTPECGPGLICRVLVGGTDMVCAQPVCNDGLDDDGDTTSDYPADPGCDGPTDGSEEDTCPAGPGCPACANGLDDDGDLLIDYPADPDCNAASQAVEGCATEMDPILVLTSPTTMGDLTGLSNDFTLGCGNLGGADRVYFTSLPAVSSITFDTFGSTFDTVLAFYPSSCMGELACNDDTGGLQSQITLTNLAAGGYALVVAHYSSGTGQPFTLHTTGVIAPGGACDGALATSGALVCGAPQTCVSGTCQ